LFAAMIASATVAGIKAYRRNVATAASHLGQRALLDDLAAWLANHAEPSWLTKKSVGVRDLGQVW
jgi:hypothetical protein